MSIMDTRSEAALALIYPPVAAAVRAGAAALATAGTYCLVASGLRTFAQQAALFAQGRTAPGHIVTNAQPGYSMHNYAFAVDVVPYLSGQGGALNYNTSTPQYGEMVAAMKAAGLAWGGDWKHFPDMDHFQIAGLPATPSSAMIASYLSACPVMGPKNLQGIWDACAAGRYSV